MKSNKKFTFHAKIIGKNEQKHIVTNNDYRTSDRRAQSGIFSC